MVNLRSLLFVPGNSMRMLTKSATLDTDAIILDLEDAVPILDKETARIMTRDAISAIKLGRSSVFVRVNALSTKMTVDDFMTSLPEVTVWGAIPSVALCEVSMPDSDFNRLLDETIAFAADHPRLILGIADTTPANASFERILSITERVRAVAL